MFKKFSVEWLSQSFHAQDLEQQKCVKLIPSAPDAFKGETKAPSSPANSCGYTSASESDESEGESAPQRRVRTKFSSDQISRLEKTFSKHKYLGATQRRRTADKLQLSETQVKTWFQNRRMKLKREVQDARAAEFFVPTVLPPVTSFQHLPILRLYVGSGLVWCVDSLRVISTFTEHQSACKEQMMEIL
ncbi:ventral expressed homeobox [Onychostoma macrolepis]|uniref:ventral expressed homeobox n=1 Tax=Onychostoma macrolepis TaxID=369639 RepID=UPI002729D404|nr:ventral expressed homeobox [Onychostoma macrolepis]